MAVTNKILLNRAQNRMNNFGPGLLYGILLILLIACSTGCVKQFIPQIQEEKELLVVQGLITDQDETDTVKLSKSLPLGQVSDARPVSGYDVMISDDAGNAFSLSEISAGTYITPANFRGVPGRFYTLHLHPGSGTDFLNYESVPMEMKPVPPIDSLYYVKTVIQKAEGFFRGVDGCQIYLNTHDPENKCKYFRWDFAETWILRLLFPVDNQTCWVSDKSHLINIKSTAAFDQSRIDAYPINYISNVTDRLKRKYSILVNQYSLNEDEYIYWEKIKNIAIQVGGLYDVIPASVPSNLRCIEDPAEKVLGYFSVSARKSKRIYIKENFEGIINKYANCATDTIPYVDPPGLGINVWILFDSQYSIPPFRILTDNKGCADCTVRGTTVKPSFWEDKK
jgi:hypothetical protein